MLIRHSLPIISILLILACGYGHADPDGITLADDNDFGADAGNATGTGQDAGSAQTVVKDPYTRASEQAVRLTHGPDRPSSGMAIRTGPELRGLKGDRTRCEGGELGQCDVHL